MSNTAKGTKPKQQGSPASKQTLQTVQTHQPKCTAQHSNAQDMVISVESNASTMFVSHEFDILNAHMHFSTNNTQWVYNFQ